MHAILQNDYIPRITDTLLKERLKTFGAVTLEGPKWCGKTTTAKSHAFSEISIADPEGGFRNRTLAELEPQIALEGANPRLIDEWQEVPHLWDAVRYECDRRNKKGLFILTGSSTPKARPMHSGAGRIARLRMSTMTLQEMGISTGDISLSGLFEGKAYATASQTTLPDIAELVVRGGWPSEIKSTTKQAMQTAVSYLDAVIEDDISEVDETYRDPQKVRNLFASLARNESTLATKKTILSDIAEYSSSRVSLSEPTLDSYLGALRRMYVVEDIPAWSPPLRSPIRIRSAAKHHLADPSLAAAALGATPEALIKDPKTLGCFFESLAAHDLLVYAQAMDANLMHYRDNAGLEVDLIVERRDGSWGAFEVKLGAAQIENAAASLNALERKINKQGDSSPLVKGIIVGVGAIGHMREDGVQVIPLDTLGI